MKISAETVRISHFHAHDINKSLRHIVVPYNMRFCKEEGTGDNNLRRGDRDQEEGVKERRPGQ